MRLEGVSPAEIGSVIAATLLAGWLMRRAGASGLSVALRMVIVAAIAAAMTSPTAARPGGRRVVLLIDRSASVAPTSTEQEGQTQSGSPLRIQFGDGSSSDLTGALDLAGRAAGDDGRIILFSDGHATGAEPFGKAAELAGRGIQVDAVQVDSLLGDPADVALQGLDAPNVVRVGDPLSINVGLRALGTAKVDVVAQVDGREVARHSVEITDFERIASIDIPSPANIGDLAIDVEVVAEGDPETENNHARIIVGVVRPPDVLVIGEGAAAVTAAGALESDGLSTTILGPARAPVRAEELQEYDAMVLVDTPASALALDQRAAIEAAVETLGLGLVMSGGRQSFALGGWRGTALERLSPLSMDPAPRSSREPVSLVLLMDRSASMGGGDGRVTKLDLAREAALLAAEALEPQDRIGVVAYDETARWLIDPREVGVGLALAELESALRELDAAGGTRILGALDMGFAALAAETGETRHAVLFSDGQDLEEDVERSKAASAAAAASGSTLSTIAIGVDADAEFLRQLAQLGRGRFHSALEPGDLPRLLLDEGEIVGGQVERRSSSRVESATPRIDAEFATIDLSLLPPLEGHLALEPHPDARRILDSDGGDPLLVSRQRGLGRVMAWSSDMGDDWASGWIEDGSGSGLWGRMVRSVARRPVPPLPVRSSPTENGVVVEIDITALEREAAELSARLVITDTLGDTQSLALEPGAIGSLETSVQVSAGDAVAGRIEIGEGAQRLRWPIVLRRDPNPELIPQRDAVGVLAGIAGAGNGTVLEQDAAAAISESGAAEGSIPLWPFLVAFAAVAWPVDITMRLRGRAGIGTEARTRT